MFMLMTGVCLVEGEFGGGGSSRARFEIKT